MRHTRKSRQNSSRYRNALCAIQLSDVSSFFGTKFCDNEDLGSTPNECIREAPAVNTDNFRKYSTISLEVGSGAREDVS